MIEEIFTVRVVNNLHYAVSRNVWVFLYVLRWWERHFVRRQNMVIVARSVRIMSYLTGFIDVNFLFMLEITRPHTAGAVLEYLKHVGIQVMEWPTRSSENLWDELKGKVGATIPVPAPFHALVEEWENIPQDFIVKLIRSTNNRIRAVLRLGWSYTVLNVTGGRDTQPALFRDDRQMRLSIWTTFKFLQ